MENLRKHSRADAGFEAEVVMGDSSYAATTCNLSMKGLLARTEVDIPEGRECEVRIRLAPALRIVVEGSVVRSGSGETAIEFTSMDDESFAMLHRLMQFNAPDADVIDEELRHPGFAEA